MMQTDKIKERVVEQEYRMYMTAMLLIGLLALTATGAVTYWLVDYNRTKAEINQQTEVERIRLEEERKLEQTKERMKLFPWSQEDNQDE